jgi:hypothetical protein
MRTARLAFLLFLSTLALRPAQGQALAPARAVQHSQGANSRATTVILADPSDPYFALAEEIAGQERLPVLPTLEEALAQDPTFLVWVASPGFLSDQAMVDFGEAMRGLESSISAGILSGTTIDDARRLWLRAAEVQGERLVAANASNPSAHIVAGITTTGPEGVVELPLTKANLVTSLKEADYLTFTGHGSGRYLGLDEATKFGTADIPPLRPAVIATGNCNSFRPWEQDSLPLAFVRQGAGAFVGYVYSPIEGYLLGQYDAPPFRYTWPDFPVGHAVQVLSRGTVQGFARLPYLYLLGDPRQSLQAAPPYEVVADQETAALSEETYVEPSRVLSYSGAPAGVIPVKIPEGARYAFVEIPEVSAAWQGDPFYNSRLQMADIGKDKYILFLHEGGDFSIHLRLRPSWGWVAGDLLLDALDNSLLFMPQTGGEWLMLAAAGVVLIPFGWLLARRAGSRRVLAPALLTGLGAAAAHGLYALARSGQVTMISKPVQFGPLALASTFLWVSIGTFLYLRAGRRWGRAVALLVALLPAVAPAFLNLGFAAAANWGAFRTHLGVSLYNGHLGLQASIAAGAECVILGVALALVHRRCRRTSSEPV